MGTAYRHTQVSPAMLAGAGIAVAVMVWVSLRSAHPVPIITFVFVGVVLLMFSSLTIVVRDEAMDVFFGPGVIRRRIPLRRIREVRVVRTPWYYGWGIRLTPSGWLWNVSGLDGVEIRFDDGHRFRVGSDEPHALAEALLRELRLVDPAARG